MSVTHCRIQRTASAGVEEPDATSAPRIAAFLRSVGPQPDATASARAVAAALLRIYPLADEVEIILEAGGAPGLKLRRDGTEAPADPSLGELVDDSSCSLTLRVTDQDGKEIPVECHMVAPMRYAGHRLGTVVLRTCTPVRGLTDSDLDLLAQLSGVCGMLLRMARVQEALRDCAFPDGMASPRESAVHLGWARRLPLVDGVKFLVEQRGGSGRTVDFYDALWVAPQRLAIMLGNVTGTTAPAALLAPWFATRLRFAATAHPDERPDQSLALSLRDLARAGLGDNHVDCTLVLLDTVSLEAEVATTGDDAPLVWRRAANSLRRIYQPYQPVPGAAGGTCRLRRLRLAAGDSMLVYTRGVVKAPDARGQAYGMERLERSLGGGLSRFSEMVARTMSALRTHLGGEPPTDDLTVLGVVIAGMGGHRNATRSWPGTAPEVPATATIGSGTST